MTRPGNCEKAVKNWAKSDVKIWTKKGTWKHRKSFPSGQDVKIRTNLQQEQLSSKEQINTILFYFTLIASFTMHCISCGVLPHDSFAGALHFISLIFQIIFYEVTVHCHSLSNNRLHVARGSCFVIFR